jgi:hypothetical protein
VSSLITYKMSGTLTELTSLACVRVTVILKTTIVLLGTTVMMIRIRLMCLDVKVHDTTMRIVTITMITVRPTCIQLRTQCPSQLLMYVYTIIVVLRSLPIYVILLTFHFISGPTADSIPSAQTNSSCTFIPVQYGGHLLFHINLLTFYFISDSTAYVWKRKGQG